MLCRSKLSMDLSKVKRWGAAPASEQQINAIKRRCKKYEVDCEKLTKLQASQILNRILTK